MIRGDTKKGTRVYYNAHPSMNKGYEDLLVKGMIYNVEAIRKERHSDWVELKEFPGKIMSIYPFTEVSKNMLQHLKNPFRDQCKGLFFRGYSTEFFDGKKVERKEGVRFLKRVSCEGCDECGYLLDDVAEGFSNGEYNHVILPNNIEHGALYSVAVTDTTRDWETGIIDEWITEFYKVEEVICLEENFKKLRRTLTWEEKDRIVKQKRIEEILDEQE